MKRMSGWVLGLCAGVVCGGALAQAVPAKPEAAALSDAERAKRDAAKVFTFIRLQARPAPATRGLDANARAAASDGGTPPASAVGAPPPEAGVRVAAAPSAAASAAGLPDPAELLASQPTAAGASPVSASLEAVAAAAVTVPAPTGVPVTPPASAASAPEPEPLEALTLLRHVQPELPAHRLANQRSGTVLVQFTVQPDGTPAQVAAKPGSPLRLAQAAVRAVEQWRFAPIRAPRDVAVEVAFQLD